MEQEGYVERRQSVLPKTESKRWIDSPRNRTKLDFSMVRAQLERIILRCKKGIEEKTLVLNNRRYGRSYIRRYNVRTSQTWHNLTETQIQDLIEFDEHSITMAQEILSNMDLIKSYSKQFPRGTRTLAMSKMLEKLLRTTTIQLQRMGLTTDWKKEDMEWTTSLLS